MRILAVDDENRALNLLKNALTEAVPTGDIHVFQYAADALADVKAGFVPDVAFLDIEMPEMSGVELAVRLKTLIPAINIIFVTAYTTYAMEALNLHASGYLLKPASAEQIRTELANLRNPIRIDGSKRLVVRAFQNFDVFCDGRLVHFTRSRSKEVFAYLVDRGGTSATYAEIAAVLWEEGDYDRSRQKQLQVFIHELIKTLREIGAEDVIVKTRLGIAIDPNKIDCDAYRFMQGEPAAINSYRGEYMSPYSWAEFTNGRLLNMTMN